MTSDSRPNTTKADSSRLGRDDFVVAAIRVLDDQGLAAFSMRLLGDQLGVSAMAMYRHVPNRGAMVELAAEAALHELQIPDGLPGAWRDRLTGFGWNVREVVARHRWLAQWLAVDGEVDARTGFIRTTVVAVFEEAGFSRWDALGATNAYRALLAGFVLDVGSGRPVVRRSGTPRRGEPDVDDAFALGLTWLFDGLEARLDT